MSQLLYSGTSIKQLGQGTGKICSLYYEDYEVSLYRGCFPYILLSYWGKKYRSLLQRTTLSRGSLYRRSTVKYMEKNLSIMKLALPVPWPSFVIPRLTTILSFFFKRYFSNFTFIVYTPSAELTQLRGNCCLIPVVVSEKTTFILTSWPYHLRK